MVMYRRIKSETARLPPGDPQPAFLNQQFPGGEGGIRTHGGRKAHNGFRDRPNRPLWHLSEFASSTKC